MRAHESCNGVSDFLRGLQFTTAAVLTGLATYAAKATNQNCLKYEGSIEVIEAIPKVWLKTLSYNISECDLTTSMNLYTTKHVSDGFAGELNLTRVLSLSMFAIALFSTLAAIHHLSEAYQACHIQSPYEEDEE